MSMKMLHSDTFDEYKKKTQINSKRNKFERYSLKAKLNIEITRCKHIILFFLICMHLIFYSPKQVQKTLITSHKKHPVIVQLAEQMREHGYIRSPDEINTRIKNLKCFYNRIKKDIDTGIVTEPTWKHYKTMEEIVTRPVFGNRLQQPHLQHLLQQADDQNALENCSPNDSDMADEEESTDSVRPEDLLSMQEDDEADMDFDNGSLVPKDEPLDIDEMEGETEA